MRACLNEGLLEMRASVPTDNRWHCLRWRLDSLGGGFDDAQQVSAGCFEITRLGFFHPGEHFRGARPVSLFLIDLCQQIDCGYIIGIELDCFLEVFLRPVELAAAEHNLAE